MFFVGFRVGVFLGFWLKTGELSAVIVSGHSWGSWRVWGLCGVLGGVGFWVIWGNFGQFWRWTLVRLEDLRKGNRFSNTCPIRKLSAFSQLTLSHRLWLTFQPALRKLSGNSQLRFMRVCACASANSQNGSGVPARSRIPKFLVRASARPNSQIRVFMGVA